MNSAFIIVKRFGGARAMARRMSLPPSTIQSWKKVGHIPAWHQSRVLEIGRQLDPPLRPEEFFAEAPKPRRKRPAIGLGAPA